MVDEAIQLATALVDIARDLLTGSETPRGAEKRVRDILPERSASEDAADDLARSMKLQELDEVGADEEEQTWPGQR